MPPRSNRHACRDGQSHCSVQAKQFGVLLGPTVAKRPYFDSQVPRIMLVHVASPGPACLRVLQPLNGHPFTISRSFSGCDQTKQNSEQRSTIGSQCLLTRHENKRQMANPLKKPMVKLLLAAILVSISYHLGSNTIHPNNYSKPEQGRSSHPPLQCLQLNFSSSSPVRISPSLHFEPSHRLHLPQEPQHNLYFFKQCPQNFTNYMPCHDPSQKKNFSKERLFYRERHCPKADEERVKCLVPKPAGYQRPFPWPKSKDLAWFKNVPFNKLTVFKKSQNWVRLQGDDLLVFPGGGTSFPDGVKGYVDLIKRVVPLKSGKIRTALDVGCGVSFMIES